MMAAQGYSMAGLRDRQVRVAPCLWTPVLSASRGCRPNSGQLCGGKHHRLAAARGLGFANKTQTLAEITS
jgi:hypothetical protein